VSRAPVDRPLELVTDNHPAYRVALSRHRMQHRFRHQVYPNPPRGPKGSPRSRAAILRDREMFAVDLLHGLIRHSCAHHRRETIAFSRRLNALLERGFLLAAWRNFVKTRSERRSGAPTPAMVLGLARQPWEWPRVLARRLFSSQIPLPPAWRTIYRREWETTVVAPRWRHQLENAV
jgi:hypothetical protein